MEQRYLIDSNVIIEYLGNTLPVVSKKWLDKILNEEFNISVIVGIEVLGHINSNQVVFDFISLANIIYINKQIFNKTIELRKNHKIKLPDAIICATCLVDNFILVTRNTDDFKKIEGLTLINPHLLVDLKTNK